MVPPRYLFVVAAHLAACAPAAVSLPGAGGGALARTGSRLDGLWRLETSVFPGSPGAGLYVGTLDLRDDGGGLSGQIEDWSNGARSQLTGRRYGSQVILDRVDGPPGEGFRATYEGEIGGGSGVLRGRYRADPESPYGNAGEGTFRAIRLTDRALPPPVALLGGYRIVLSIAAGFPAAGGYSGTLTLAADGDQLRGVVDDWSNGARSTFRGTFDGARLVLLRTDGPPWTGMRARFDGWLAADGSVAGTFENDPCSPYGSAAAGTWRATHQ